MNSINTSLCAFNLRFFNVKRNDKDLHENHERIKENYQFEK